MRLGGHPLDLALFRVAVCGVVLASPESYRAVAASALPPELRTPPVGTAWAASHLPIAPPIAAVATALLVLGCALGAVGLFARPALALAAVASLYALGLPQLGGAVVHDHHLVWFLALLAASPCADALSVDAALARRRGRAAPLRPSARYGVPLAAARALVAVVFFFPGLWKLRASGLSWIASDNLRNQMWWKWYETGGGAPLLRVDRHPTPCAALAGAAVLFELGFVLFVWSRRTRPFAGAAALAFHAGTRALLRIGFSSLWLCYGIFFDAPALVRRLRLVRPIARVSRRFGRAPVARTVLRATPSTVVVAGVLLAGSVAFGAAGVTQGWPFACYPTFQSTVGDRIPRLVVDATFADGRTVAAYDAIPRTNAAWAAMWSAAGLEGAPASAERLAAYWATLPEVDRAPAAGAASLTFYRAWYAVDPDRRGDPPLAREELATVTSPPRPPSP